MVMCLATVPVVEVISLLPMLRLCSSRTAGQPRATTVSPCLTLSLERMGRGLHSVTGRAALRMA